MALLRRITLIAAAAAALTAGAVVPATSSFAAGGVPAGCSTQGTLTSGASKIPCPTLLSPANNTDTAVKDLALRWTPVEGASKYQVQISPNHDWTNNVVDLDNNGYTISTWLEAPVTLPHTTYYWRVRAQVGGVWGGFSQQWQFLRNWEAPLTILHSPTATDPTITWAPVPEASEYQVLFEAQNPAETVAETQAQLQRDLTNNLGCFTAGTSFTPNYQPVPPVTPPSAPPCTAQNLAVGTTYVWGVVAEDDTTAPAVSAETRYTGCGGSLEPPECDGNMFIGSTVTPALPTASGKSLTGTSSWHASSGTQVPCDATTACPMTPTFTWTPVSGATNYEIRVYLDRDATNVYSDYATVYPQFTPPNDMPDAQPGYPYFWDVEAETCGGTGVVCTAPPAVTQNCPDTPSGTAGTAPTITSVSVNPAGPHGNTSMQGGTTATVTLGGTGLTSGACVTATGGVVTSAPTVGSNGLSFSYWAPVDGGAVTFQATNPDGTASGMSTPITVASSATALALSAINSFQKTSGPVTLTSPANGAIEHGHAYTFHWKDYLTSGSQGGYDVKNYELQVSRDDTFTTNALDVKDIDLTRYTDETGALNDGHYFWRVAGIDESDNALTWSAVRQFTVNATAPKVHIATKDGHGVRHPLRIKLSEPIIGVNRRTVKILPQGESTRHALAGKVTLGSSPRIYVFTPKNPFAVGGTYVLHVSPSLVDANGNPAVVTGDGVRIKTTATNRSPAWRYSHGWQRVAASSTFSGSYVTAGNGHSARVHVDGSTARLYACKGPNMGDITVTVAGHSRTVSEHQSFTRCGVAIWHKALPSGIHTLTVRVASGHGNFDAVKVG